MAESSNKQDELNKYYNKIFGDLNQRNKRTRRRGLKNEIENRKKELEEYQKSQNLAIESIRKKIIGLMPNAASVGLAKSFAAEKKQLKKTVNIFNVLFCVAILGIITVSILNLLIRFFGCFGLNNDFSTWIGTIQSFLPTLPILLTLDLVGDFFLLKEEVKAKCYYKNTLIKKHLPTLIVVINNK